jgi:hypothetical protein
MAAPQGFEPRLPESKSGVLPLDEEAINLWYQEPGSNRRHRDFQSRALPTELSWQILAGPERLELPTLRFVAVCSNPTELRADGVKDGTRTRDNRNHNPGLYQLSYRHHCANCSATAFAASGPGCSLSLA